VSHQPTLTAFPADHDLAVMIGAYFDGNLMIVRFTKY